MKPYTNSTFLPLMDEDHNTILHEALYRAFDGWYDPTVLHPYYFANAWNGLNVRSAPSLDSAVVGELDYGAPLGIISADEGPEVEIDGLKGKWIYVGSDVGRGWTFDGYISPVPVFEEVADLKEFALNDLGFRRIFRHDGYPVSGEEMHDMIIYGTSEGPWFIEHYQYEYSFHELKIPGLSLGQATVMVRNFLKSRGFEQSVRPIELPVGPGQYFFKDGKNGLDGRLPEKYKFRYAKGTLSIIVDQPHVKN